LQQTPINKNSKISHYSSPPNILWGKTPIFLAMIERVLHKKVGDDVKFCGKKKRNSATDLEFGHNLVSNAKM